MKFVGEIGINRTEYLYILNYVDILQIERGYNRRNAHLWSATRWSTYYMMSSFCGSEGMEKAGIYSPMDLIQFPWEQNPNKEEETEKVILTDEDVEKMRENMRQYNEEQKRKADS